MVGDMGKVCAVSFKGIQSLLLFCPVVPDGYGLSYSIGGDHIRWTITSLKLGTEKFKACLAEAATETRQMMERAGQLDGAKTKL
jgi:Choline/Carnitine o-acyltransferase